VDSIQPVTLVIVFIVGHRIGQLIGATGIAQETHIFYVGTTFSNSIKGYVDIGYLRRKNHLASTYQKFLLTSSIKEINKIKKQDIFSNFLYKFAQISFKTMTTKKQFFS